MLVNEEFDTFDSAFWEALHGDAERWIGKKYDGEVNFLLVFVYDKKDVQNI